MAYFQFWIKLQMPKLRRRYILLPSGSPLLAESCLLCEPGCGLFACQDSVSGVGDRYAACRICWTRTVLHTAPSPLVPTGAVVAVVRCSSRFLASTSAGVRTFRLLLLYVWREFAHFTQNFTPRWAAIWLLSITVRLTIITHSVRTRTNFQGLLWSEFDGLGENELLIRICWIDNLKKLLWFYFQSLAANLVQGFIAYDKRNTDHSLT